MHVVGRGVDVPRGVVVVGVVEPLGGGAGVQSGREIPLVITRVGRRLQIERKTKFIIQNQYQIIFFASIEGEIGY